MNSSTMTPEPRRRLTGKTVLICLVGFFGIVATVNAIMLHAAVTTFAGTKADSAYRAGLAYNGEAAAASAQDALNWRINGQFAHIEAGQVMLMVDVTDAHHAPIPGLAIAARLAHPLNAKLDREMTLARVTEGTFRGVAEAQAGQWELTIDVMRDGRRVYRNVSRVVLK